MLRLILLTVFLLFCQSGLLAQVNISLSGKIIDAITKKPLQDVTLLLFSKKDSTQKAAGIINEDGRFVLPVKDRGDYFCALYRNL